MSGGGKKGKGNQGGKQGGKPEGGDKEFKFNFGGAEGGENALKFDFGGKDAAMLPFIQQRLGHLIGTSSGYLEQLPESVQNRIKVLKKLHEKKSELDQEYKKELVALQDKFNKLIDPLFERRRQIVQGTAEPTEEEFKEATKEEKKEGEEKVEVKKEGENKEKKEEKKEKGEDVKGIPDFWMNALKHHDDFGEMVTEKDEKALKHLIDVRWKPLSGEEGKKYSTASFVLEFEFSDNIYFTNKIISKTFYLTENEALGETMFDRMETSSIDWKNGKNLTVEMVKVEQPVGGGKRGGRNRGRGRGKSHGQTKIVMVEEPCESFFNFFNPNIAFGIDEEEEELNEDDMQELYEADYEMGLAVKEQIIPSAVLWFTGEIQTPFASGLDFGDEEGAEDEGGEYDSAEDADFNPDPNQPQEKPECKQQ